MATPDVSGVAAIALEAHPDWDPNDVRLAIANTADPSRVVGYRARLGGSGLVQPFPATRTAVAARGTEDSRNLRLGVEEASSDFVGAKHLRVPSLGSSPQGFNAPFSPLTGAPRPHP